MFEAERVVFLVAVGLSLVGLDFGGTKSGCSGLDGAGFAPRPRVRAGVSSWSALGLCDARAGWLREAGIGTAQQSRLQCGNVDCCGVCTVVAIGMVQVGSRGGVAHMAAVRVTENL
jgi:hypothetical protein